MQDPLISPSSTSFDTQTSTSSDIQNAGNSRPLNLLLARHPYLAAVALFIALVVLLRLLNLLLVPLVRSWHLTFFTGNLLEEALFALFVTILISMPRWWSAIGFTRGINGHQFILCLMPIVLIVLPVLCGFPALVGKAPILTFVLAALLSLLIGFAEEGFFRGVLLQVLLPKGIWLSVILSSLFFACAHLSNLLTGLTWNYVVGQLLLTFGSGLLFAAVRLRTASLWPVILLHAARDIAGLILFSINPKAILSVPLPVVIIVNGILCALFALNAIYLLRPKQLPALRAAYHLQPTHQLPNDVSLSSPPLL